MGKSQRTKGAAFERLVANLLKPLWAEARRGLVQSRAAGEDSDVTGTPFWIECKAHRQVSIPAAYAQATAAKAQRADPRPALVVSKNDRGEVLATMSLADWMQLVERAQDQRDVEIARERLDEIQRHPETVVTGAALESRLGLLATGKK